MWPKLEYTEDAEKIKEPRKYREAVGSLIYLSTCTRPDITFVFSKLSQHIAEPNEENMFSDTSKVHQNRSYASKWNETEKLGLRVYSDADWSSDVTDRCSTSGYCASQGSSLISLKTRKQAKTN